MRLFQTLPPRTCARGNVHMSPRPDTAGRGFCFAGCRQVAAYNPKKRGWQGVAGCDPQKKRTGCGLKRGRSEGGRVSPPRMMQA